MQPDEILHIRAIDKEAVPLVRAPLVAGPDHTARAGDVFRNAMGADDGAWARGRAHALYHAVTFIPYYRHTAPDGVAYARRLLDEALGDSV